MTKLLLSWKEIRERGRKIAHNSALKIKETTGREMNTSKTGKTTAQPTPILDLDSSVYIRIDGACNRACSKAEQLNSEGEWEALTSFGKNKQIRKGEQFQNVKIHDACIQQSRVNQMSKFP